MLGEVSVAELLFCKQIFTRFHWRILNKFAKLIDLKNDFADQKWDVFLKVRYFHNGLTFEHL